MLRCISTFFAAPLVVLSLSGAEWRTGQAANNVYGQASFSEAAGAFAPIGLNVDRGNLHAADRNGKVLTFALRPTSESSNCPACFERPNREIEQRVPAVNAAYAANGRSVAMADRAHHQIVLWRNGGSAWVALPIDDPLSVALDANYVYAGDGATHQVLIWKLGSVAEGRSPDARLGAITQPENHTGAATIGAPAALASNGTELFVADPLLHRVLAFHQSEESLDVSDLKNAASLRSGTLAPGLSFSVAVAPGLSFNHAAVVLNGRTLPEPELRGAQLYSFVPATLDLSGGVSLSVEYDGRPTNAIALEFQPTAPGIFAFPGTHEPRSALSFHSGGVNDEAGPVTDSDPLVADAQATLWATGLGAVSEDEAARVLAPVTAELSGVPLRVLSANLPRGSAGVYEVTIELPSANAMPIARPYQIRLECAGLASNEVTIAVRPN